MIWSVTSFILEVPSGAWADVIDRRTLLVVSSPLYAAGFAAWIVWPTFAGFAIGFALWGLSSALVSGTFEAYLYDGLAAHSATAAYAGLLGWCNSAAMAANLAATAAAAPLFAVGGFAAVAWVSVAIALLNGVLAWALPSAAAVDTADETTEAAGDEEPAAAAGRSFVERYTSMLRAGLGEATRHRRVRHLVLIAAVLYGLTAYDEYFGLVALEAGATTAQVPLLVGLTVAGQLLGTALAGRMATRSSAVLAAGIGAAGVLIALGALAHHPLGFVAIAIGYGLNENAVVVSDARLQDTITGPARATVTSVTGLSSEVVAVAIFVTVAAGASWWSTSTMLAIVALPTLAVAVATWRWTPDPTSDARE